MTNWIDGEFNSRHGLRTSGRVKIIPERLITLSSWSRKYLGLSQYIAEEWSKDPSTKVGAVIERPNHTTASLGINGFPIGVADEPELYADREQKYPRVVHAEMNAMNLATERLDGCTLYLWPLFPCTTCAGVIIQRGIKRVVCRLHGTRETIERYKKTFGLDITADMFVQAGVNMTIIETEVPL